MLNDAGEVTAGTPEDGHVKNQFQTTSDLNLVDGDETVKSSAKTNEDINTVKPHSR